MMSHSLSHGARRIVEMFEFYYRCSYIKYLYNIFVVNLMRYFNLLIQTMLSFACGFETHQSFFLSVWSHLLVSLIFVFISYTIFCILAILLHFFYSYLFPCLACTWIYDQTHSFMISQLTSQGYFVEAIPGEQVIAESSG